MTNPRCQPPDILGSIPKKAAVRTGNRLKRQVLVLSPDRNLVGLAVKC